MRLVRDVPFLKNQTPQRTTKRRFAATVSNVPERQASSKYSMRIPANGWREMATDGACVPTRAIEKWLEDHYPKA